MLIDSLWLGFLMQKPLKLRVFDAFLEGFESKTSCFGICEVRAPARISLDREQTSQISLNLRHIFLTSLPPKKAVCSKKCKACCRYKVSTMFQVVQLTFLHKTEILGSVPPDF